MFDSFIHRLPSYLLMLIFIFIIALNLVQKTKNDLTKEISQLKIDISLKMNLPEKINTAATFCEISYGEKLSYEETMKCQEVSKPTVCQNIHGEYYFCREQPDLSKQLNSN